MAEVTYRNEDIVHVVRKTAWGAIWAGMFSFVAIWSVFGMLGEAIFARTANPNALTPAGGVSVGMGIWAIVLTVIAMFVAGRVTSHFADIPDRAGRIMHGMTMFGLSVIAIVAITNGGAGAISHDVVGTIHNPYMLSVFSHVGWVGFVALFLGWLAAMGGAAQGSASAAAARTGQEREIRGIRSAA